MRTKMGSKRGLIGAGLALTSILTLAYGAGAASPKANRSHEVRISRAEAKATVGKVAAGSDLNVSTPQTGLFHNFYLVDGSGVHGSVDAYNGALQSILLDGSTPNGPTVRISDENAQAKALGFLQTKDFSVDGLSPSVQLDDHGSFMEFVVSWQRRINGALVPDQRIVSVNPQTGAVFSLVNVSYAYDPPPTPVVLADEAISLARSLATEGAAVESTDLVVTFDEAGNQLETWRVGFRTEGPVPSATLVQVNAINGAALVIGRG